jgi:hypothetical protein
MNQEQAISREIHWFKKELSKVQKNVFVFLDLVNHIATSSGFHDRTVALVGYW